MGIIFPLSGPGKIALLLIAVVLGVICYLLWFPEHRKKLLDALGFKKKE